MSGSRTAAFDMSKGNNVIDVTITNNVILFGEITSHFEVTQDLYCIDTLSIIVCVHVCSCFVHMVTSCIHVASMLYLIDILLI